MKPKLVIVGGGYVGSEAARRLDAVLDVTLIEPREAFVHVPAMIRALVEPALLERAILPYDRLLRRGRILRGRAAGIRPDGVLLEDGSFVPGDVILVATGSDYAAPFKPQGGSIAEFRRAHAETGERLRAARHIAIAGAGPVGIELAGEIAWACPGKSVSLIAADEQLLPDYPARLGRALEAKLASLGVSVIKGRRARLSEPGEPGPLILDDDTTVSADLVLPAVGARGRNGLLADLPGVRRGEQGRVLTDDWLRPAVWPNLFSGGDVAEVGDAMTIVATMRQVPFLVRAIRTAAAGGRVERLRPYRPWKAAPILLPLGPRVGNSFLPAPGPFAPLGVVGNLATRRLKGADLFVAKYRRAFGRGGLLSRRG